MSLANSERKKLADTLHAVGPDAATLCDGWSAHDLLAHLWLRETDPIAAAGMFFPPLAKQTIRKMEEVKSSYDFDDLVDKYAAGPRGVFKISKVNELGNTLECFVHHEDLRRGDGDNDPRTLPKDLDDALWSAVKKLAKVRLRGFKRGLILHREGQWGGASESVSLGENPMTISGEPGELVMLFFGRGHAANLDFDPEDAKSELEKLKLSV